MINSIKTVSQAIENHSTTVIPFKSNSPGEASQTSTLKETEPKHQVEETKSVAEQKEFEERQEKPISQEMLDELSDDIKMLHSIGLSFAQHEDTGRTMVKVMDKENNQLIRQIPAEDVLDMAAKMDEMIGLLFDEKV